MRSTWCVIAVLLAACSDSATEPAQSDTDLASIMAELAGSSFAGTPTDGRVETACPGGGKRISTGTRVITTVEGDQTSTFRGETVHLNCVSTDNGRTIVTHGVSQSEGYYTLRLRTQPFTYLALQARGGGTMTVTLNGKSQTCTTEMTMTYDPNTNLLRIAGTSCGRAFDNSQPLN